MVTWPLGFFLLLYVSSGSRISHRRGYQRHKGTQPCFVKGTQPCFVKFACQNEIIRTFGSMCQMRPLDQPVTMSDMVNFQKKITCQNKRIWTQRKGRELAVPPTRSANAHSFGSKFSLFLHRFFPKSHHAGHWYPTLRGCHPSCGKSCIRY